MRFKRALSLALSILMLISTPLESMAVDVSGTEVLLTDVSAGEIYESEADVSGDELTEETDKSTVENEDVSGTEINEEGDRSGSETGEATDASGSDVSDGADVSESENPAEDISENVYDVSEGEIPESDDEELAEEVVKHVITYYNCEDATNNNPPEFAESTGLVFADPERIGYSFKGWFTDKNCTKKITEIKAGTAKDIAVYAKWAANTYFIAYDRNESSITDFAGAKLTLGGRMDKTKTLFGNKLKLRKNAFAVKGYSFEGWNTMPDGSGDSYTDLEQVSSLVSENNGTVTLYARWKKQTYKINYVGLTEDVSGEIPATEYQIDSPTIDFSGVLLEREGYDYKGLYSNSACNSKLVSIKEGSVGDKNVYIKWNAHRYFLTFDKNIASITDCVKIYGSSGSMGKQTLYYGKSTKISANRFAVKGYAFVGWNTEPDGSGRSFTNQEIVTGLTPLNDKAITLYAQWEKQTYKINYVGYTEDVSGNLPAMTYQIDTPTISFDGVVLEKTGYDYKGLYSNSGCSSKLTSIKEGSTGDKNVYIKWLAHKYYFVFNKNLESITDTEKIYGSSGSMGKQTLTYGKSAKISANKFAVKGYTFMGWNTEPDGSGTSFANQETVLDLSTVNNDSINLYAQWKKTEYTITYYNYTEDVLGAELPTSYYIDSPTIEYNANLERSGYVFKGYYSNSGYSSKLVSIKTGSTGDRKVYLKWTPNKYFISYNMNADGINGAKKTGSMKNQTITYGTKTRLTANAFAVSGCNFSGWNTMPDGSGRSLENKEQLITELAQSDGETVTLYAQWEKLPYSITYYGASDEEIARWGLPTSYAVDTETIVFDRELTRTGYNFIGYYTSSSYGTVFKTINQGSTGNKNVYLKFEAQKHTIHFDANGGEGTMKDMVITYGAAAVELRANTFTYKGHSFAGWKAVVGETEYNFADKEKVSNLLTDLTLVAQWTTDIYYIKYENLTEEEIANAKLKTSYSYGEVVNLSGITIPTRTVTDGDISYTLTFEGFFDDKACTKPITSIDYGDKTIYASWRDSRGGVRRDTKNFSDSYMTSKYYTQLINVQTQDSKVDTFIAVAMSQKGYHESYTAGDYTGATVPNSNATCYTEYARWYGNPNYQWCDIYIEWCLYMSEIIPKNTYMTFKKSVTKVTDKNQLKRGDAVHIGYSNGKTYHWGIVINNPSTDGYVQIINGNWGCAVKEAKYKWDSSLGLFKYEYGNDCIIEYSRPVN